MKAEDIINELFSPSGCLTKDGIRKFISNQLEENEIDMVKKHIDSCDLCSQAIEGAQLMENSDDFRNAVDEINNKIRSSKDFTKVEKPRIIRFKRYRYISMAASIVLLVGLVFIFNIYNSQLSTVNVLSEQEIISITNKYEVIKPSIPVISKKTTKLDSNISLQEKNRQDIILIIEDSEKKIKQIISYDDLKNLDYPISSIESMLAENRIIQITFDRQGKLKEVDVVANTNTLNEATVIVASSPKKIIDVNEKELRRISYSFPVNILRH